MDDADKIIFQTLKTLGWEAEDDCTTLRETSLPDVAIGLVKCLHAIDMSSSLPNSFPQNIAQRYKVATAIADNIKKLDYPGEIGYPTIMYPNETQLRHIFMFLIDKLPKEAPLVVEEANDRLSILHRKARLKIKSELSRPWIPFHCMHALHKYGKSDIGPRLVACTNENNDRLGILLDQHTEQLASSKLEQTSSPYNDGSYERSEKKLVKIPFSLFEHTSRLITRNYDDLFPEEDNCAEMAKPSVGPSSTSLSELLEKKLIDLDLELSETGRKIKISKENVSSMQTSIKSYTDMISTLEQELSCLSEITNLEGDLGQIQAQLSSALETYRAKEKRVTDQWIKHKSPFETELTALKEDALSKQGRASQMRKEIVEAQDDGKLATEEIKKKKASIAELQNQLQLCEKGINRSEYTGKILDITNKVERQRQETDKVIVDIKQMHKEVNLLTGKLSRTFNHVENVIFNKIKGCSQLKEEYIIIINIHEAYGELNDKLYEILNVNRETASLKQQVEAKKKEDIEKQLDALQRDLQNILKENKILAANLNCSEG